MKKLKITADDPRPILKATFVDLNASTGGDGSVFTPYNLEDLNKIIEKTDLKVSKQ